MDERPPSLPQFDFAAPLLGHTIPRKPVPLSTSLSESDQNEFSGNEEPKRRIDLSLSQAQIDREQSRASKPWRGRFSLPQRLWSLQAIAPCLCLATFVSMVIVLQHYNGRRQNEWPYHYLTLNGLVALLATITRASAMVSVADCLCQGKWDWFTPRSSHKQKSLAHMEGFDEASRGAWGSLKLLWMLKGRYLGSLGALLTILFLAFDIFSQQVIGIEWRNTVEDSAARAVAGDVARSQKYDRYGPGVIMDLGVAELAMKAAIYNGVMSDNLSTVGVSCSTGNCSWPIVPSLGVCGECTDRADSLNLSTIQYENESGRVQNVTYNYTLPDGNWVAAATGQQASWQTVFQTFVGWNTSIYNSADETDSNYTGRLYLASFDAIGTAWNNTAYQALPTLTDPDAVGAAECGLWFCVQAYNISTNFGIQNQTPLMIWDKVRFSNNGMLWNFVDVPANFNVAEGTQFQVGLKAQAAVGDALTAILSGSAYERSDGYEQQFSNDGIQGIWQGLTYGETETAWIENLALSMSNTVRLTAPANTNPRYARQAYSTDAFVHVRWSWLAFPAAMVVGSILFLLASIWQTSRSGVPAWKGSPLELLFFRLSEDLQAYATIDVMNRPGALVRRVGEIKVLLDQHDGTWTFRREDEG